MQCRQGRSGNFVRRGKCHGKRGGGHCQKRCALCFIHFLKRYQESSKYWLNYLGAGGGDYPPPTLVRPWQQGPTPQWQVRLNNSPYNEGKHHHHAIQGYLTSKTLWTSPCCRCYGPKANRRVSIWGRGRDWVREDLVFKDGHACVTN